MLTRLCLTWSETPKINLLATGLKLHFYESTIRSRAKAVSLNLKDPIKNTPHARTTKALINKILRYKFKNESHYVNNVPMQYTAIFKAEKRQIVIYF